MFFSKRSIFSTVTLAAIVGITSWLTVESSNTYHKKEALPKDFIENTATNVTLYQMNETGTLRYQAYSTLVDKMVNSDAKMSNINMTMEAQKEGELPWNITSDHGYLSDHNEKLKLWGNVIIKRPGDGKDKPPLKITTSILYVYPNKDFAETDQPVKMEQLGSKNIITGTGMKAHMNPEKIQLLSNVRSYYEDSENKK
ncbi:LPS export ABC transporter periplasmic protein LptC [Thiotrichales bacterium 19S9-11]|nr:LPS export ABC transporter periplasmic protein LptC [Thiotrichales bacterium 19S9-11]